MFRQFHIRTILAAIALLSLNMATIRACPEAFVLVLPISIVLCVAWLVHRGTGNDWTSSLGVSVVWAPFIGFLSFAGVQVFAAVFRIPEFMIYGDIVINSILGAFFTTIGCSALITTTSIVLMGLERRREMRRGITNR